jgi:hypothetical protein
LAGLVCFGWLVGWFVCLFCLFCLVGWLVDHLKIIRLHRTSWSNGWHSFIFGRSRVQIWAPSTSYAD